MHLQFKVFINSKINPFVYRTLFTRKKIFGFYADISHKVFPITAQVFEVKLDHKPKTMQKVLNDIIANLL